MKKLVSGKLISRKNNSTPKIEFISRIPYLEEVEEIQPKPSVKFLPEWWKDMPYALDSHLNKYRSETRTAKKCPSFPDYFSAGYILPMWADTVLYFSAKTGEWKWQCGSAGSPFVINFIEPHRFQDYGSTFLHGQRASAVWHFTNPWEIITPPGYQLLQLPLLFHDGSDFAAFPGLYEPFAADTEKVEIATYKTEKEIFIKRGTPLVQYIPFKYEKFDMVVRPQSESDKVRTEKRTILKATSFNLIYNKLKTKK